MDHLFSGVWIIYSPLYGSSILRCMDHLFSGVWIIYSPVYRSSIHFWIIFSPVYRSSILRCMERLFSGFWIIYSPVYGSSILRFLDRLFSGFWGNWTFLWYVFQVWKAELFYGKLSKWGKLTFLCYVPNVPLIIIALAYIHNKPLNTSNCLSNRESLNVRWYDFQIFLTNCTVT